MPRKRTGSVTPYRDGFRVRVAGEYIGVWSDEDQAHRMLDAWLKTERGEHPNGGVYAVQGAGGMIKIGKSKDIRSRILGLQGAHPVPLTLVAILSRDPNDEARFHHRWAHLRRSGEWFEPAPELLKYLSQADIS